MARDFVRYDNLVSIFGRKVFRCLETLSVCAAFQSGCWTSFRQTLSAASRTSSSLGPAVSSASDLPRLPEEPLQQQPSDLRPDLEPRLPRLVLLQPEPGLPWTEFEDGAPES